MKEIEEKAKERPILTTALRSLFSSLPSSSQSIFLKIFNLTFLYMVPLRSLSYYNGVLRLYWLMPSQRAKYDLTDMELSLLSLIYHITECGKRVTTKEEIFAFSPLSPGYYHRIMPTFRKRGYLLRFSRDPALLHYRAAYCPGFKYINISPIGIQVLKSIELDMRNALYNNTLKSITGK